MSARRLHDVSEVVRYEGSNGTNNRQNRWPTLTQTQISNGGRLPTSEEKTRRSQVFMKLRNFISSSFIIISSKYLELFMDQVGWIQNFGDFLLVFLLTLTVYSLLLLLLLLLLLD
jgi:hypothetical protein